MAFAIRKIRRVDRLPFDGAGLSGRRAVLEVRSIGWGRRRERRGFLGRGANALESLRDLSLESNVVRIITCPLDCWLRSWSRNPFSLCDSRLSHGLRSGCHDVVIFFFIRFADKFGRLDPI